MVVEILDKDGVSVGSSTKSQDTITIPNAKFWWPYTMNSVSPGYLYTLKVVYIYIFCWDIYLLFFRRGGGGGGGKARGKKIGLGRKGGGVIISFGCFC